MARVYVCDACGITIKNPYQVKMKEFYIGVDIDLFNAYPINRSSKKKIHLCEDCFKNLKKLGETYERNQIND